MLNPGIKGSASVAVTAANTAAAMGSGELNVFATPALAALVEKACWQSVAPELDPGCGTVGTKLELAHNAPTPVGMMVRCESELTAVDGRKLTFSAVMYDDAGEVGRATHERFIIQNEKFQKKADAKKGRRIIIPAIQSTHFQQPHPHFTGGAVALRRGLSAMLFCRRSPLVFPPLPGVLGLLRTAAKSAGALRYNNNTMHTAWLREGSPCKTHQPHHPPRRASGRLCAPPTPKRHRPPCPAPRFCTG